MGACLLCCPPALPLVGFYAPLPRRGRISPRPALAERSSRREGGVPKFISPGAPPPAPRRRAAYGTYRHCRTSALRRETCGSPHERRQTVAHSFASVARVQPRGCKGRSPLHKITLSLPLPAGKGAGGMGAGKQAKVKRQAGNKEGKPPAGYHSGKVSRRQRKQAPRRHLFALPRGRGPSQTPPSLATDSSISPGPPSPWLPALPKGKRYCHFSTEPQAPFRRVPAWQVL